MLMKITYYQDPFGGYHGVTDESPKGLAGCVCAGRGPDERGGIGTIKERAYAINVLQKWERVEEVPVEWLAAIGYEQPQVELKLEFAPRQGVDPEEYTKDPVFWMLCVVIFAILWWYTREIFP